MRNTTRLLLVCCAAIIMLVTGCNNTATQTTSDSSTNVQQATEPASTTEPISDEPESWISDEPIEITWIYQDNASFPYNKDWLALTEIKERTNVDIQFILVASSDYETKKNILVNSGDIPDVFLYSDTDKEYMLGGLILPISDYLDKLPNFSNRISSMNLDKELENYVLDDGKYYVLPWIDEVPVYSKGLAVRLDVLEENNLAAPETYEELFNDMVIMKQNNPDTLPMTAFWGLEYVLNFMEPSWTFHWKTGNDNVYYDWDTGQYESSATSSQMQALLIYLNRCYEEGLFDPEIFTQDLDQWTQKLVTSTSMVTFCWADQLASINSAGQSENPDFNFQNIVPPKADSDSPVPIQAASPITGSFCISNSIKDEPYFDNILKFIDWLFYSDEGVLLTGWGVEDVSYVVADGKKDFTEALYSSPSGASKQAQIEFGLYNFNIQGFKAKDRILASIGPVAAGITEDMIAANMFGPKSPMPTFTMDESEEVSLLSAPIMDYVTVSAQAFVQGTMDPVDDWDAFVAEVESMHIKDIVDMYNAALTD